MKKKTKKETPRWIETLQTLIQHKGYNPRSLSIKAGLNATAVRDILEGRAKSPRYETLESLAKALDITPDALMKVEAKDIIKQEGSKAGQTGLVSRAALVDDDLELLTEIIVKLQETAESYKQQVKPQDFAAMVTTIYRHVQMQEKSPEKNGISGPVKNLITYESLRKKTST